MIPKFRVWDKERGMMQVHAIFPNHKIVQMYNDEFTNYMRFFDDICFMQSTGLKDINGIEIFEGDIVETRQIPETSIPTPLIGGVVVYDIDYGMFKMEPKYGSKFHAFTVWLNSVEILGNIYENLELLGDGE
ncbi:YopX family protein [Enterococcus sp. DIV0800]|uniref:YopX family protein n=1 Tax=unclassified Enterococcus TaxID=2608891 RepID=UPI003D3005FE